MPCQRLAGRKHMAAGRPPFLAASCAWQTKPGNDGRPWTSTPNDRGQFVWVPVAPSRIQRARSAVRRAAAEHGPAVAQYAAGRAARALHTHLMPGVNYFNHQLAWRGL